jgi:hypothetical protein
MCKATGSIQLFLNRNGKLAYARTRHYSGLNKDSKKPMFTYCKIEDLDALKTLLKSQVISMSNSKAESGQVGQGQTAYNHDLKNLNLSLNQQNQEGRSSSLVRTLALRAKGRRFKSGSAHL